MVTTNYDYLVRQDDTKFHLDYNEYNGLAHVDFISILNQESHLIQRYPNVLDKSLNQKLSTHFNINEKKIALTNGCDLALEFLLQYLKLEIGSKSVSLEDNITYDHFIQYVKQYKFELEGINKSDVHYICTPNNPSGAEVSPKEIYRKIATNQSKFFIIDLTYAFYSKYKIEDYINLLNSTEINNMAFVLSFSKAYPVSGSRLGLLMTNNWMIQNYFKQYYNHKSVSPISKYLMDSILNNEEFYVEQRKQIFNNRLRLGELILSYAKSLGYSDLYLLTDSGGNFIRVTGSKETLVALSEDLLKLKISVRWKEKWSYIRVSSCSDSFLLELIEIIKLNNIKAANNE